ncbi:MAG: peptidoglycan DD-metalloendopeptidase family protein [Clostridia bacterium]|nr:peptidoglycan DD-metalloendopeptidase family protein [Clostridia bacterium]
MDKKHERKWRMRQLKLRSAIFFRKNGLYVMALGCLAVLGIAAALIFSAGGESGKSVNRSDDQRLADVEAQASPTPEPTPAPSRAPWIMPTPHTVMPTSDPRLTPVPDFTVPPEETPDPLLGRLQSPVGGSVIRVFALNSLIYSKTLGQWMTHPGVDIAAAKGNEVRAVLAGTVERVYSDDMLGVTVVIRHENGLVSVYSSLREEPPVSEGSAVEARQVIGYVGDTAIGECAEQSHLHFELHYNGSPIDPAGLIIFNKE